MLATGIASSNVYTDSQMKPLYLRRNMHQHVMMVCCLMLCSLSSAASPLTVEADALRGEMNRALISGNLAAIDALSMHHPEIPGVVFDMLRARIRYDLDASSSKAKMCEATLQSIEPKIAFYCARLVAGNIRLDGRLRDAAREELDIAQRYAGKMSPSELANPDLAHAKDLVNLPFTTKQVPSQTFSIPLDRDESGHITTRLTIDNVSVNFLVDTAAYTILSTGTAEATHAHIVQEQDGTAYGASGHGTKKKLAIVDSLKIGDATLHNVPVAVADIGIDVLGLDVLRFVAPVRVSRSAMHFYPHGSPAPGCDEPLNIGAPPWGTNPQLISYQNFDGYRHPMVLDTGSIFLLTGTKRAERFAIGPPTRVQMGDLTARSRATVYRPGHGSLTIGGVQRSISFMVLPDYDLNYDFLLGNRALDEVDFFIDFDHRHLCLLRSGAN